MRLGLSSSEASPLTAKVPVALLCKAALAHPRATGPAESGDHKTTVPITGTSLSRPAHGHVVPDHPRCAEIPTHQRRTGRPTRHGCLMHQGLEQDVTLSRACSGSSPTSTENSGSTSEFWTPRIPRTTAHRSTKNARRAEVGAGLGPEIPVKPQRRGGPAASDRGGPSRLRTCWDPQTRPTPTDGQGREELPQEVAGRLRTGTRRNLSALGHEVGDSAGVSRANARLNIKGHLLLVDRVRRQGWAVAHAAKSMGISRQCAHIGG